MKNFSAIFVILFLLLSKTFAQSIQLPQGVTMDTIPEGFTDGLYRHHLIKDGQVIAMIVPKTWHNNDTRGTAIATSVEASLLMGNTQKQTFSTVKRALQWLVPLMDDYYAPRNVQKWKSLKTQPPKVKLKYPWEWDYKLDRLNAVFKSKAQSTNRLVLIKADNNGSNEVVQIIRTPNDGNLTIDQVVQYSVQLNKAINLQQNPLRDSIIGGKVFKTTSHLFLQQMEQRHFWYADATEIIYVGVNLFREDRVRLPRIVKEIVESIKW
ncbi:MAG: hypothetical protein ACOYKE_15265 [Ferruginibacter sp.]